MEQSQAQSGRFWKPAAFGGALLSAVGLYEPAKDLYLKVYDPDYKGVVSVTLAEQQLKLADQNAECFLNMKRAKVQLSESLSMSYGACPNNNIHIGVYPKNKAAYQRWIEPNREQDVAFISGVFPSAFAGYTGAIAPPAPAATPVIRAQVELKTVCQEFQAKDKRKIIRITDEAGQCFFERVNVLTGVIEVREKAECSAKCSAESAKYR
ncbi:MAG TPA: hypothetical protein VH858_09795 [Hyphomicrobiales bacterium]|jgi:hypothetical protein